MLTSPPFCISSAGVRGVTWSRWTAAGSPVCIRCVPHGRATAGPASLTHPPSSPATAPRATGGATVRWRWPSTGRMWASASAPCLPSVSASWPCWVSEWVSECSTSCTRPSCCWVSWQRVVLLHEDERRQLNSINVDSHGEKNHNHRRLEVFWIIQEKTNWILQSSRGRQWPGMEKNNYIYIA